MLPALSLAINFNVVVKEMVMGVVYRVLEMVGLLPLVV
jgi:hypothetical protein